MELFNQLKNFANHPIPHGVMLSILKNYSRPNDKIHELLNRNILVSLKKGLYITGEVVNETKPEPMIIANHLFGPSYVSANYALSYYGLNPERVYEITSMTPKSARKFENSMGLFSYKKTLLPYFSLGIKQLKLNENQYVMIASKEKALCDTIIISKNLTLRSLRETKQFLLEDLRLDTLELKKINTETIASWIPFSPKKNSLLFTIKAVQSL